MSDRGRIRLVILGPTLRYGTGGVETQTAQLSAALKSLDGEAISVDVTTLETYHLPCTLLRAFRIYSQLLRADVVLSMGLSQKTWAITALSGCSLLISHHTFLGGPDWVMPFKFWVFRRSRNVANSIFVASALRAASPKDSRAIRVIYPCCPEAFLDELPCVDQDLQRSCVWDVAFVGRLIHDKGAHVLIEALRHLGTDAPAAVQLIGDGPDRIALQHQALASGLKVGFSGLLSTQSVADELRRSRVVVIPSLWQEPFGVVMLEALAAGCRVIASDVGGLPEAGGALARYVPPGDAGALAEAIRTELLQPSPIDWPARQAHLQRFRPKRTAQLYLDQIRLLLASPRGSA